jgi:hypothetical protein
MPAQVVDLIRWGMEKDPLKRPKSAAEFRQKMLEVRNALPGAGPVQVQKKSLAYASTKMNSMVVSPAVHEGRGKARKVLYVVGALAAVMLIAAGVLLTVFSGGTSKNRDATPPGAKVKVYEKVPAEAGPPAAQQAEVGQPPSKVRIELENAPEGVRIFYHGEERPGGLLEVDRGNEPVLFTIRAEGFEEREVEVVPSKDMKVDGEMEAVSAGKPKKTVKKKDKKQEGSAETKKKGLGHVWDYP